LSDAVTKSRIDGWLPGVTSMTVICLQQAAVSCAAGVVDVRNFMA
jgi:hypothetical protein